MTQRNTRYITLFLLTISSMFLSGCLTKEDTGSDSAFAGNPPVDQNSPPLISGNPQTAVMMGDNYSFTPTANDPDGDALTFSVSNLPAWASFSSGSGTISGQPSLADVGVYSNVTVSVSDGASSAGLPAFDITVTQAALGSMTLSWTPPTENTDGSTLTDLAGYRIYYGTSQGNYPNRVDVDTAGVSSYVVDNLLPNTYFVVATSVNSVGVESAYSNVAIKTVEGS